MINQSPSLSLLFRHLQKVPYLASKNLYLVGQHFLDMNLIEAQQFCDTIINIKKNLDKCAICWIWKEKEQSCPYCVNSKREKKVICVVETWRDIISIERAGGYHGIYHVLGGLICPLDGIGPENLTINYLIERITNSDCSEIILALNQTPEGEATSAYIATKLKNISDKKIVISCLARGLPVGSSIENMDRLTVYKSLSERRPF